MRVPFLCLLPMLIAGPAAGTEVFTGETAALIDWAVKTCELRSSARTRELVEQAKAKAQARFSEQYMKGFSSKLLAEANASRKAEQKLCEQLTAWYGPAGSRIAGLLHPPPAPLPATGQTRHETARTKGGGEKGPGKGGP
ncbi:MAG: hypothetical protein NW223_22170 [Hyphomicrobiaceae bacterium]|nr:hypothetical protein [Hyphomicrobiaceae bacterium]